MNQQILLLFWILPLNLGSDQKIFKTMLQNTLGVNSSLESQRSIENLHKSLNFHRISSSRAFSLLPTTRIYRQRVTSSSLPISTTNSSRTRILGLKRKRLQPFVVVYHEKSRGKTRNFSRFKRYIDGNIETNEISRVPGEETPEKPLHRHLTKVFVEFQDIGIEDVIAPRGFNFSFCSGECLKSGINHKNGSYAIMHSLLHRHYPNLIPKEFCEPRKFSGISVLIFREENVELVKLHRIRAKKC